MRSEDWRHVRCGYGVACYKCAEMNTNPMKKFYSRYTVARKDTDQKLTYTRHQTWIGHIAIHDSLLRRVIEGKMEEKKTRGRRRTILLDHVMDKTDNCKMTTE